MIMSFEHVSLANKPRGVKWRKDRKKWAASIIYKGKSIYLGNYTNLSDATAAYDEKAIELYGNKAITNEGLRNKKEILEIPDNPADLGYRGVQYIKKSKIWMVRIKYKKQIIYLGSYYKLSNAITAYDSKAIELFGPEAITNKLLIENGLRPPITDKFNIPLPDITDLPGEIWKNIEGFESYQVSNMGRVKSLVREFILETMILKPNIDFKGYLTVGLTKEAGGLKMTCKIHILVAKAFIPNPKNLPEVNHKNLIKSNNTVKNLEWILGLDNHRHAYYKNVWTDRPIQIEEVKEIKCLFKEGYTRSEVAKIFNISYARINHIYKGTSFKDVKID